MVAASAEVPLCGSWYAKRLWLMNLAYHFLLCCLPAMSMLNKCCRNLVRRVVGGGHDLSRRKMKTTWSCCLRRSNILDWFRCRGEHSVSPFFLGKNFNSPKRNAPISRSVWNKRSPWSTFLKRLDADFLFDLGNSCFQDYLLLFNKGNLILVGSRYVLVDVFG